MIVLDEQISRGVLRRSLDWYPGQVRFLKELRPGTIIKDESVPSLLRAAHQPTFLTINVSDFWLRAAPDRHYCVICFPLTIEEFRSVPGMLRPILRLPELHTKAARLGKIVLAGVGRVRYYSADSLHLVHEVAV